MIAFFTTYGVLLDAVRRAGTAFEVDSIDAYHRTGESVVVHETIEEFGAWGSLMSSVALYCGRGGAE